VAEPNDILRVVVAEDNLLVREGVRQVLDLADDLEIVGVCSDGTELRAVLNDLEIDVVVTDVRMPPSHTDEGIQIAAELRASHPEVGVVVLSQYAEPAYAQGLLGGGSSGRAYLLKERVSEPGELVNAVRAVASGGSVVDPTIVDLLVTRASATPLDSLTPREREVLDLVAQGKSNAGVAAALFLSERAVEKHINSLFPKLGLMATPDVNRRVAAVLMHLSARHTHD
jgi:DNA-binding NarL/FixJ family response regulator